MFVTGDEDVEGIVVIFVEIAEVIVVEDPGRVDFLDKAIVAGFLLELKDGVDFLVDVAENGVVHDSADESNDDDERGGEWGSTCRGVGAGRGRSMGCRWPSC